MKRSIFRKSLALFLCLLLAISTFSVNVFAIGEDADIDMGDDNIITNLIESVYVDSTNGNDSNDGSQAKPFATLDKALNRVANGGTITIVGTYSVPANFVWKSRSVTDPITITGGTLTLSSDLVMGTDTTFKNITINGSKNLFANGNAVTFDNVTASAVTIYGGGNSATDLESTNVTINSGTFGTVYGGSSNNVRIGHVYLTVNGGTINSIFGGNNASNLVGDVTVKLLGGTFTRRIFGGCNNEFSYKSGSFGFSITYTWATSGYVNGNVDVVVSEKATINTDSSSEADKAFFGHSRQATLSSTENSSIIFLSTNAFNNNSSKLGTKENSPGWGKGNLRGSGMGTSTASSADNVHVHGTTADDSTDTITENCTAMTGTACSGSNAVTLTLDKRASLAYTGEAITPMIASVTGRLSLGEPVITYSNNVNVGTATATMTYNDLSVSKTFTIVKGKQSAPKGLSSSPETISKKADGKINGLTTDMEFSTNDTTFTKVTDTNANFAAGTYYVRYAETDSLNASASVAVAVAEGKKLVVTYIADGKIVDTQELSYGASAVAPAIPSKTGYTQTAPYWDIEATNVTTDLNINAVYTKDITPADTNDDGNVNLKDLITLARYVAGWNNADAYVRALDIDGDGEIKLADVTRLAQYLAGHNVTVSSTPYIAK